MSDDEIPDAVERAFDAHDAFEPRPDGPGYDLTTTVFDVAATATEAADERDGAFHATITLPTLDASVEGGVAAVVDDDWYATLERRLQDVYSVATTTLHDDDPDVERDTAAGEVTVTLSYTSWEATEGVEDAKALVEYVEGTFAQGVIPGYEYRGPAGDLLDRARQLGERAAEGDDASR